MKRFRGSVTATALALAFSIGRPASASGQAATRVSQEEVKRVLARGDVGIIEAEMEIMAGGAVHGGGSLSKGIKAIGDSSKFWMDSAYAKLKPKMSPSVLAAFKNWYAYWDATWDALDDAPTQATIRRRKEELATLAKKVKLELP